MPTASSSWKTPLSEKSGRCSGIFNGQERGALPWLIVVISVRQSTVAAISGLLCRALVMVSSSIRLTAAIAEFKEETERNSQRDWCMSRVTAIISLWLSASSSACHGLLIIYREYAITWKAQRDKNARELEAGERGNYWQPDASAWCCCRCKPRRS